MNNDQPKELVLLSAVEQFAYLSISSPGLIYLEWVGGIERLTDYTQEWGVLLVYLNDLQITAWLIIL